MPICVIAYKPHLTEDIKYFLTQNTRVFDKHDKTYILILIDSDFRSDEIILLSS